MASKSIEVKKWEYKEGTLYHGDIFQVLKKLPDKSVDLVFGSPPYEDARTYNELGFSMKGQVWVDWMVEIYKESLRVCKGLVAYVVGHGRKGATNWTGVPVLLAADLIRAGICLRNPAIYERDGIPGSGGPDWLKANYEWIICATNGGRLPWANNVACGHKMKHKPGGPCTYRNKDGKRVDTIIATTGGYKNGDVVQKRVRRVIPDLANPGLIIKCAVGSGHMGPTVCHENEAPFPEKLADFFIKSFCPPDGIVLDPFSGSGTTASMAIKNGRRFIAGDIRDSQITLTKRRIKIARDGLGFGM